MKKGFLFFLLTIFSFSLFCQETEKPEKKTYENESKDRLVLGFTFDNWIKPNVDSLKTKWNSFGFNFAFMYDKPFGKSPISFAIGMGVSASWVKNNSWFADSSSMTTTIPLDTLGIDYKRNSLITSYFDIPIEFRLRTRPGSNNKSFKMGIGAVAGVRMSGATKLKTDDKDLSPTGEMKVFKTQKWNDLNRFRFGPTFRIGYGSLNLYAFYNVIGLFKKDQGPKVYPISAGISINGL